MSRIPPSRRIPKAVRVNARRRKLTPKRFIYSKNPFRGLVNSTWYLTDELALSLPEADEAQRYP